MKNLLVIILFSLSSIVSAQTETQDLVVTVDGIIKQEGEILIALFDSEENFLGKRLGGGSKPVDGSSITFTFNGLKEGTYAISIFHDINSNKELDSNFMGIPNEPYAFSNNAKGMFGPPKYEDCKFEVKGAMKKIAISL